MPNSNLITAGQLRDEIGGPTWDTTAVGHMTDDMLQSIIDRYSAMLEAELVGRLSRGELSFRGVSSKEKTILTAVASPNTNLATARLGFEYFPWFQDVVDQDGLPLDYDPDINQTLYNSPFPRYRWSILGRDVMVSPSTTTSIQANVVDRARGISELGADLVAEANDRIIAAAKAMLAARIAEQGRLVRSDLGS
jgi:hypothetical protein